MWSKKGIYLESYVDFGFDLADGVQKPKYINFSKMLGNRSLNPSIMKAHITSSLTKLLLAKCARLRAVETLPSLGFAPEKKLVLSASYRVFLWIAKKCKPHIIEEGLM